MVTMLHLQYVHNIIGVLGVQGFPSATIAPLWCSSPDSLRTPIIDVCFVHLQNRQCSSVFWGNDGIAKATWVVPNSTLLSPQLSFAFFLYVAYVIAGVTSVLVLNIVKVCRFLCDLRLFMKFPSTHWTRW
jgi:hypothetical protein